MMKKVLMAVAVVVAAVQSANASIITFSQADLLAMTVYSGVAAPTMNAGPTYTDTVAMTGLAGSRQSLDPGELVTYRYNGSVTLAAGDIVQVVGHNDNDDIWDLGLWYDTDLDNSVATFGDVAAVNGSVAGPPNSAFLSFVATGSEVVFGVFVRYNDSNTGADTFHASWGVPEPGSLAVWGLVCGIGLIAGRRRRS